MAQRCEQGLSNHPRVVAFTTAHSLLLVSSSAVRKFEFDKETLLTRIRKQMVKWGLSAA